MRPIFIVMSSPAKIFQPIAILLLLLCSCEAEFHPNIAAKATPLVYGIISPQDSLYSIRLTKTFNGAGNAYDFAKIPDSIYFKDARVFLETRTPGGQRVEQVEMEETLIEDRVPGMFASTPNKIFQTDVSKIHLRQDYFAANGQPYNLNLYVKAVIPGYPDTVTAFSRLRTIPKLIEPRYIFQKVYFYTEDPFWMQWMDTNDENYFEILVRMRYTEFLYDDQRDKVAEWVLTGINANMTSFPGGDRKVYSYYFRPENFYAKLSTVIDKDPEVEARVCRKVDFIVLSSNRELEYYRSVYAISDDYHGAGYTNISNGFGLFTTYSSAGVYGLILGQQELDSLANGKYTRGLKFKNW